MQLLNSSYIIHKDGKCFSLKRNKYLTARPNSCGYLAYYINKKWRFVHRMVAVAFIPNPNNHPQVNHIDGNKQNNSIDNLEWCTASYNSLHAYRNGLRCAKGENNGACKLSNIHIEEIKALCNNGLKQKEVAIKYNVNPSTISKIINQKRRYHVKRINNNCFTCNHSGTCIKRRPKPNDAGAKARVL